MIVAALGEIVGGAFKGIASDKVKEKLKPLFTDAEALQAWKGACEEVTKKYPDLFPKQAGKTIWVPEDLEAQTPYESVMQSFEPADFPSIQELASILTETWETRKTELQGSNPPGFFTVELSVAKPVLDELATAFFRRLSTYQKFFNPAVIKMLQALLAEKEKSAAESKTDPKAFASHLTSFKKMMGRLYVNFPEAEGRFPVTCLESASDRRIDAGSLFGEVQENKLVLLTGAAGSGKSSLLAGVAENIDDKAGFLPLLLDVTSLGEKLEQFQSPANTQEAVETRWRDLVGVALPPLTPEALNDMARDYIPFLLVDRLNEVPGPQVAFNILQALFEYARRRAPESALILAATRSSPGDLGVRWTTLSVQALPEKIARDRFGPDIYDRLADSTKERLKNPYYLALAMKSNPQAATGAAAIENFLRLHVKFKPDDIDKASEAAFEAYIKSGSTVFSKKAFEDLCGAQAMRALFDAGVIQYPKAETAKFEHQLYHDFLAARHCATKMLWTSGALDGISLQANSFTALDMVVEQLESAEKGDQFLHAVYDWNFYAAREVLRVAVKLEPMRHSRELEIALLALMSEKRFDGVLSTRESAKEWFGSLEKSGTALLSETSARIRNSADRAAVAQAVRGFDTKQSWFQEWRSLFLLSEAVTEKDVLKIVSPDSILGWTAANVLRCFGEDQVPGVQLRAIYWALKITDRDEGPADLGDTIRWRIVSVLGAYPTMRNAELLLKAMDEDRYHWTRYGAGRSLVECAARTQELTLREFIVAALEERVNDLTTGDFWSFRILDAIGRAVFFCEATAGWEKAGAGLLQRIVEVQPNETTRNSWAQRAEKFRNWTPERDAKRESA